MRNCTILHDSYPIDFISLSKCVFHDSVMNFLSSSVIVNITLKVNNNLISIRRETIATKSQGKSKFISVLKRTIRKQMLYFKVTGEILYCILKSLHLPVVYSFDLFRLIVY